MVGFPCSEIGGPKDRVDSIILRFAVSFLPVFLALSSAPKAVWRAGPRNCDVDDYINPPLYLNVCHIYDSKFTHSNTSLNYEFPGSVN